MDRQTQSNGFETFLEHWGVLITVLIALAAGRLLTWLSGALWVWFRAAALMLMIGGAGLIGYAKFPVYRSGRFLTFGVKSVPQHLRGFYQWGWRVFLFGVILGLCLLWARP